MTHVGIIGLGLIGGSIGLALRAQPGWRVTGYDSDCAAMETAKLVGACDHLAQSLDEIAACSQIVVIAVPCSAVADVVKKTAPSMKPGSVLTDVASVKWPILTRVREALPAGVHYVGGHPMAGLEKHGIAAARADLFQQATWVITPTAPLNEQPGYRDAVDQVEQLIRATGATPLIVDPQEHDMAVAFTSHLPYIVSLATALAARNGAQRLGLVRRLVAGGFRDTTRLARSNPSTACDYSWLNRGWLKLAIEQFENELRRLKQALDRPDMEELLAMAKSAMQYLDSVEWGKFDVRSKGA